MDINKALLDPQQVFHSPHDVLGEPTLSYEEKKAILERWEYDAKQLEVADDENMAGFENDVLDAIKNAMLELEQLPH